MAAYSPPALPSFLEKDFYTWVVTSPWFQTLLTQRGAQSLEEKAKIAAEVFYHDAMDFRTAFLASTDPIVTDGKLSLPNMVQVGGADRLLNRPDDDFNYAFQSLTGINPSFFGSTPDEAMKEAMKDGIFSFEMLAGAPPAVQQVGMKIAAESPMLLGAGVQDIFNPAATFDDTMFDYINLGQGKVLGRDITDTGAPNADPAADPFTGPSLGLGDFSLGDPFNGLGDRLGLDPGISGTLGDVFNATPTGNMWGTLGDPNATTGEKAAKVGLAALSTVAAFANPLGWLLGPAIAGINYFDTQAKREATDRAWVDPDLRSQPESLDPGPTAPIGPGLALGPEPEVTTEPLAPPAPEPEVVTYTFHDGGPADPGPTDPGVEAANDQAFNWQSDDDGGGGDGGGGGCVVCTTLHDHRLVEPMVYSAITEFGRAVPNTVMRGYHVWGKPLARLLDRSERARKIIGPLARPVVRELAHRGGHGNSSRMGAFLLRTGIVSSALVAAMVRPNKGKSCANCQCDLGQEKFNG